MTRDDSQSDHDESVEAEVEFDGSSRGNPGPSGYGAVLKIGDREYTDKDSIGEATNNQAEYQGLIAGLELAREEEVDRLLVTGDTELVINQMAGDYDVKSENLKPLHNRATDLAREFDRVRFEWNQREENKHADELAQRARDDAPVDPNSRAR